MSRRRRKALLISAILGFVLFHFQNCGSPGSLTEGFGEGDASEVRIVDDWRSKPLQFTETIVQVRDGVEKVGAQGLCLRKEVNPLNWYLINRDGDFVKGGSTECEMGGFQIDLSGLGDLQCGREYYLMVENRDRASADLSLVVKCPALLAEPLAVSGLSGDAQKCFKELQKASVDGDLQCQKVCYQGDRLIDRERLNLDQCAGLLQTAHKL